VTSPANAPAAAPAPMPAPVAAPAPGRARLRSYALWQLRDYFIAKGIATVLINGLMLFIVWSALPDAGGGPRGAGMPAFFIEFMNNIVLFGVLFATNGIVAEDRKLGYYRFYFSKPVSVAAFYTQKFAVHLLGLLLISGLLLVVYGLLIEPRYPSAYFPVIAMMGIGLGGVGFLLSALFTLDWLSLFAIYAVSDIGWRLYGDDPGVRGFLIHGFPPVHQLRDIYAAVTHGRPIPTEPLWWIFTYGVACFAIALLVISRRRLATN
jgi:hypothetical protein